MFNQAQPKKMILANLLKQIRDWNSFPRIARLFLCPVMYTNVNPIVLEYASDRQDLKRFPGGMNLANCPRCVRSGLRIFVML